MPLDNIKHNELIHFSHVTSREDLLHLDADKRAKLVEDAMTYLYRTVSKAERKELLSLIQTIVKDDQEITRLFTQTAYIVCDRHLVITFMNEFFLRRSKIDADDILGKSLYHEREYEGTQIEQLYSMVMETRMLGDALVRYAAMGHDGWFVIVVIPLASGGIGVLSLFAKEKSEVATEIDPKSPDAPHYIQM